ncbi:hypothetical protein ABZX93_05890 [Streptomyces sp. NPDC006632]|uniref:hypothetical protein n=1 Tax=Streptomyces sp. NPDC006632 TaxID=3157182 RepID=UPI0033BBD2BF
MNGMYFYTTNRFLAWLACRGILFVALLLPAANVMAQLNDTSWAFNVGSWVLGAISIILLVFHVGSHGPNATCQRATKTCADLKKRRYRLVLGYSRTWPLAVVGTALLLVLTPIFVPYKDDQPNDSVSLRYTAVMLGVIWIGLTLLAAYLFRARNAHHLPSREPSPRALKLSEHVRRVCHRSHWFVLGAVLAASCASLFVPEHGPWSSITGVTIVLVLAAFIADGRHSDNLCETCVVEFRVDAPEYAASKKWVFTADHKGRRVYWIAALTCIAIQFTFDNTPASTTATMGVNLLFVASAFINRFHRTYQPWCPYCHGGGGGGHEHTEVPDPTGGHGRPVPV